MLEQLDALLADYDVQYDDVTAQMSLPEVISDRDLYRKLAERHAYLQPIVDLYRQFKKVDADLKEHRQIIADPKSDAELRELATDEVEALSKLAEDIAERLREATTSGDPLDNSDVVLEIRAGTGGSEAGLFCADLMRMYMRYAEGQSWKVDMLEANPSEMGGFKEVILGISGNQVYRKLKFESGVHRVQRVPKTESQGRLHTSAATVAVLAEAPEIEVDIKPQDLRIDVFRSSGPGGQSVNTTDSAVRITHVPTGIVAQSQDEKSQHKNKAKALKVLKARIYDAMLREIEAEQSSQRRSMVGSGDRSERIRTYNFPQARVTDHRIGLTSYRLADIIEGDIDEFVEALHHDDQAQRLKEESS